MRIEFILTYNSKPQEIFEYPFINPILTDKQTLFDFATAYLSNEEKQELIKISSCVLIDGGKFELPKWFVECNGKLYFKKGIIL